MQPTEYFAGHPVAHRIALAGALGTSAYATVTAVRTRQVRYWLLAGITAVQVVGLYHARPRPLAIDAQPARTVDGHH